MEDFEAVFNIYQTASTVDQRLAALGALGAVCDLKLVDRILQMVLDPNIVKPQDVHYPITSLVKRTPLKKQVLPIMWKWIKANWNDLYERFSASLSLLGRILQTCIEDELGQDFADTVLAWSRGEDCETDEGKQQRLTQVKVARRPLEQSLERIKSTTAWVDRERDHVSEWIKRISKE